MCVQGMTEAEEDKLLALKDFMLKSSKAKATMGEQGHLGEAGLSGVIDLATLGITGRQVDLVKARPETEDKRGGLREGSPDLTVTSQAKQSRLPSTVTSLTPGSHGSACGSSSSGCNVPFIFSQTS